MVYKKTVVVFYFHLKLGVLTIHTCAVYMAVYGNKFYNFLNKFLSKFWYLICMLYIDKDKK